MSSVFLQFASEDGIMQDVEITANPLTIGRGQDADLHISDARMSRVHCAVQIVDGGPRVKDLQSKNGTFLNGQRIEELAALNEDDELRVGSTVFMVSHRPGDGSTTAIRQVTEDMEDGKGYRTILREIVDEADNGST